MIGVIIGASEESVSVLNHARQNGIFTIALDQNEYAPGFKFADKAIVVDISDKELVCRVLENEKFDFLLPIPIGRCLSTIGYVNDIFNIKGISYKAAEFCTDKYLFHEILYEYGLRRNNLCLLKNVSEQIGMLRNMEFPLIVKPRFGSGSRMVRMLEKTMELYELKSIENLEEDFIVEEMFVGKEYGVDAVMIDGVLSVILLREKLITPPPFQQCIRNISVIKDSSGCALYQRVESYLSKIISVLGMNNCMIHADIIISENQVAVIEISGRPAGHFLHQVFIPAVTGIDVVQEYINFLMDKPYCFESGKYELLSLRFFDFSDVYIRKIPNFNELRKKCNIKAFRCNIVPNMYMEKVIDGKSIIDRGYIIIAGDSREDIIKQEDIVLSEFCCENK